MIFGLPIISVAIWLPIIFGVLVLATGDDKNAPLARIIALVGSVLGFLVTIPLYTGFVRDTSEMQFVEMHDWIPSFNIHYYLGVDGISVLFVLLTAFFTPLVVLAGWQVIEKRVAQYMGVGLRRIDVDLRLKHFALKRITVQLELNVFRRHIPRGNIVPFGLRHERAASPRGDPRRDHQTQPVKRHRRAGKRDGSRGGGWLSLHRGRCNRRWVGQCWGWHNRWRDGR